MTTFGRARLGEWPLDPDITYLNHGTVGVTPRAVMAAQQAIRDEIERQPSRYILRELTAITVGGAPRRRPRLREAAEAIAAMFSADGDDLVFVDNVTAGANAVLQSVALEPGDEILVSDYGYGGVTQAVRYAARQRGAGVREVTIPYPLREASQVTEAFTDAVGPRTRLAVVDHVAAQAAVIFPLAEIAVALKARGVAVLGDGAHVPGALPLDIPSLGVDWYVANLHKWMWVPRSSGILWAAAPRQTRLHPGVVSWGLDQGFTTEFDAPGTRDPSNHLAAPAAIAYMRSFGLEAVQQYNHHLAWSAALRLASAWQTPFHVPESMIGTMATVMLPASLGTTRADAAAIRDRLLDDDRIEAPVHAYRERLWVRVSAQIYNDLDDIERLAETILTYATAVRVS